MKILVLNPGSTSTKVALFENAVEIERIDIHHSREELSQFTSLMDQLDFRYKLVIDFMRGINLRSEELDCVISRGGSPPNAAAGATEINECLVEALQYRPKEPHPASLGPIIAYRISKEAGIPAYIYDPITADELNPLAKIYGIKGIEYDSMCHFLNTHAQAMSIAQELGKDLRDLNIIVAHFGGGNSICLWSHGHPTDVVQGDACGFSSERAGFMRSERMVYLCKEYGTDKMIEYLHGKGGFVSLLGTNDLREVEKKIKDGDEYALLCQRAMAYHLSKNIASLFPVTNGQIDGIVLTGGGANWVRLVDDLKSRLAFLNKPIFVRPGENEMQALAEGALRVMNGVEEIHEYVG